jgi:Auxiliary Activity family 9 (formerly GH61)
MLTYMANCGSTPCNQFDITNTKWFKIQQIGRTSPGSAWAQADLSTFFRLFSRYYISLCFFISLIVNGAVATASLPKTLASGNYFLRHEIIALHLATSLGGAEFYPACAQIQVGGSETGGPTPDELVSIPGAYQDDDPGIFDPQIYNTSAPYIFPGPAIASFVGATASGTSSNGTSTGGNSSTPTTSTTPPATSSQASSKSCRLKKASPTSTALVQPRHFSRIMKRIRGWH